MAVWFMVGKEDPPERPSGLIGDVDAINLDHVAYVAWFERGDPDAGYYRLHMADGSVLTLSSSDSDRLERHIGSLADLGDEEQEGTSHQ